MTYPVNPPPYSPSWHPEPSAPPYPQVHANAAPNHAFFGDTSSDQSQLGHEMLKALVNEKTNWVIKVKVPEDTWSNRLLNWISGAYQLPRALPQDGELSAADKSKLSLLTARLLYAEMANDRATVDELTQLRKTNDLFHKFIEDLASDERNPDYCLRLAEDFAQENPEIFFEHGKLYFLQQEYAKAVREFRIASDYADKLESSSKFRQSEFKALVLSCAAAANERLGFHDSALFDYIDASKIDPKGPAKYEEPRSRNFQILKFKTNKTFAELQACIEHDPYDPDFPVDLAKAYLDRNESFEAMKLLTRSIELSMHYKSATLYRCAELTKQLALKMNVGHTSSGPY